MASNLLSVLLAFLGFSLRPARGTAFTSVRISISVCVCVCVRECVCVRVRAGAGVHARTCLKLRLPGFFHQTLVCTTAWESACADVRGCANLGFCCAKSMRIRAVPPGALPVGEACQYIYIYYKYLHIKING